MGDSQTEGLWDGDDTVGLMGFADRLAVIIDEHYPGLMYANLAVRAHLASVIKALQACEQPGQPAGATADHDIPRYVESRSPGVPGQGQPTG